MYSHHVHLTPFTRQVFPRLPHYLPPHGMKWKDKTRRRHEASMDRHPLLNSFLSLTTQTLKMPHFFTNYFVQTTNLCLIILCSLKIKLENT